MTMGFGAFPWAGWLDEEELGRRANYQSRIPQSFGYNQQEALGSLFQPTFSRYLGALGRQIGQGQAPTLSFTNYLNENFNPQRELLRFPSSVSGGAQTRAPRPFFDRF